VTHFRCGSQSIYLLNTPPCNTIINNLQWLPVSPAYSGYRQTMNYLELRKNLYNLVNFVKETRSLPIFTLWRLYNFFFNFK